MAQQIARKMVNKMIAYAFTAGIIIALILGLISTIVPASVMPYLVSLLILAGVIVGFFNINPEETKDYVLYVTALVLVTSLGGNVLSNVQVIGPYMQNVLASILAFILPSVVIVGIKAVINLAHD